MVRRLPRRLAASGQVTLPAVPSLIDLYAESLANIFTSLGRVFSPSEVTQLKSILKQTLDKAYAVSPFSKVVVDYKTEPPPNTALSYTVSCRAMTVGDEYAE